MCGAGPKETNRHQMSPNAHRPSYIKGWAAHQHGKKRCRSVKCCCISSPTIVYATLVTSFPHTHTNMYKSEQIADSRVHSHDRVISRGGSVAAVRVRLRLSGPCEPKSRPVSRLFETPPLSHVCPPLSSNMEIHGGLAGLLPYICLTP